MSAIFEPANLQLIEQKVLEVINAQADFLSTKTSESPRAAADAIQSILKDNFKTVLGEFCKEYVSEHSRRSMADLQFSDHADHNYVVDVKTHREDTVFNMPNVISVARLAKFYENPKNHFVLLFVKYKVEGVKVIVTKVSFFPIENLSWDCLSIGALGNGQIQINNSNDVQFSCTSRKAWHSTFLDKVLEFYPKEIIKINKRIAKFEKFKKSLTKFESTSNI